MSTNLDVKLRLSEIARKSAELSAVSSKLDDMASQLNRLRQLNGRIGFLTDRNSPSSRRKHNSYTSRRCSGITDAGRCERRRLQRARGSTLVLLDGPA